MLIPAVEYSNLTPSGQINRTCLFMEDENGFYIPKEGFWTPIKKRNLDPHLAGIDESTLQKMDHVGYFELHRVGKDYGLRYHRTIPGKQRLD